MMKKKYVKPNVLCQELQPETLLCASSCEIRNDQFNDARQCGYEPPGLGFRIFAQTWVDCDLPNNNGMTDMYCYHNGVINLFSS